VDGARVYTGEEKRRYPRYGFQADVDIEIEGKMFRAFMTDISADGMFVVAANPLWVGAVFTARLHIADPLSVKCLVKRVMVGRGMGVKFLELSPQDRESLDKILSGLAV
jgi:c-di-GMP-binding flagellar brake protein YcgR